MEINKKARNSLFIYAPLLSFLIPVISFIISEAISKLAVLGINDEEPKVGLFVTYFAFLNYNINNSIRQILMCAIIIL